MKFSKLGTVFGLTVLVSACGMNVPDTPQGIRDYASSGNILMEKTYFFVARSPASVNAALRAGTQKCLNRSVTYRSSYPHPSMYTKTFKSAFKTRGSRGELTMRLAALGVESYGRKTVDGMRYVYVADTEPSRGGTKVTIYGMNNNKILKMGARGDEDIDAKIKLWASGGSLRCPKMPE